MSICSSFCHQAPSFPRHGHRLFSPETGLAQINCRRGLLCGIRASMVDSHESSSSSDFVKRMEQAWLISQQPRPVACSTCNSKGNVECKWCAGTGFFILGDNMLCQVPSKNTSCVICTGKGFMNCSDCKGTGFRAKWLGKLPPTKG